MKDRCFALIPAAGIGSRIGGAIPKQYLPVAGRPMIVHALAAFAAVSRIERITIVVSPDDRWIGALSLDDAVARRIDVIRTGGATRAASVANGLAAMAGSVRDDDWVLVHDAARCGITPALVDGLIDRVLGHPVGGLLGLPVDDTMKRGVAADDGVGVSGTVERDGLWRAQTPQMFRRRALAEALAAATGRGLAITDESSAIEAAGHVPSLVRGSARNFKVTTTDDLAMMEALLTAGPVGRPLVERNAR